jgi:hypothetical protein
MTDTNVSAEIFFAACSSGDLDTLQKLLAIPANIHKAMEAREQAVDEGGQCTYRSKAELTL